MRLLVAGFWLACLLPVTVNVTLAEQLLTVKYRATPVDVDGPHFEPLDTANSSFIRGAWYDKSKQYMLINLQGTNYHYCGLDAQTWNDFKASESFGKSYHARIKGQFDCRQTPAPEY